MTQTQRVAKFIAACGYCSRRQAEALIFDGKVQINGQVCQNPATQVSQQDQVFIEGQLLTMPSAVELYIFHKPVQYLTSRVSQDDKPTIYDILPLSYHHLKPVGRLDYMTEGLLLLTNDGALKRYLELPSSQISRVYKVDVHGKMPNTHILEKLKKGLVVDGMSYQVEDVWVEKKGTSGLNHFLYVQLQEGKNREVRKIVASLGLKVKQLIRVSYGPWSLEGVKKGQVKQVNLGQYSDFLKGIS